MRKIEIKVYRRYFAVRVVGTDEVWVPRCINLIKRFTSRFNTYGFKFDFKTRRNIKVISRRFYFSTPTGLFKFSINALVSFVTYLKSLGYSNDDFAISKEVNDINDDFRVDVEMNPAFVPREYQKKYIAHVMNNRAKMPSILVSLQTGMGKTLIASKVISESSLRTMIIVLPRYIEKWVGDIKKNTLCTDDDIRLIQGGGTLKKFMLECEDEIPAEKIVIISMRTMANYIKNYEDSLGLGKFAYPVSPKDLCNVLCVGMVLNDESHQEFHALFKANLHINPEYLLGLSATLVNNDKQLEYMYELLFPIPHRAVDMVEYRRYVNIKSIRYEMEDAKEIKCVTEQGYSHVIFETFIMNHPRLRKRYFEMIRYYVETGYAKRRRKKDKLLIFIATIRMATALHEYLEALFEELEVRRYVEDDNYENVIDSDITVSTVLSSGTALDIPDLITVIHTVPMMSMQSNIQTLGRLREIDGFEVDYYYLWCKGVKKHADYDFERRKTLGPRSKTLIRGSYNVYIQ